MTAIDFTNDQSSMHRFMFKKMKKLESYFHCYNRKICEIWSVET